MGNRDVATAFSAVADVFWAVRSAASPPAKEEALAALDAVGTRFQGFDANSGDDWYDPESPIGRLIAIGFEATEEEKASALGGGEGDAWYDGPISRFRHRYRFW